MSRLKYSLLVFLAVSAMLVYVADGPSPAAEGFLASTTLSTPNASYRVIADPSVTVRWGELEARLAGNEAVPPEHRAGYNGIIDLRYPGDSSPFVPRYAGLNLEHVNNGIAYQDPNLQFEPRRHSMEIRKISDNVYELCQKPLPNTGLESCTRFVFRPPHWIEVVFECIPRLDKFPYDHLNIFWASYIDQPADKSIYFLGRKKGQESEAWIQGITPAHGELSTHRSFKDKRRFTHEDPFPLTLVFNESEYEYTKPFYYGRYKDYVWIVMFREQDLVRLTQSPSGGGPGNPAWDFQWFIDSPKKDKLYRLTYRAVYKRWAGADDVLREYQAFQQPGG